MKNNLKFFFISLTLLTTPGSLFAGTEHYDACINRRFSPQTCSLAFISPQSCGLMFNDAPLCEMAFGFFKKIGQEKIRPAKTVFLPYDGQTHEIGRASRSWAKLKWLKTWKVEKNEKAGSMLKTDPVSLPPGKYGILFQFWHRGIPFNTNIGQLRALQNNELIKDSPVYSKNFENILSGGYQREILEIELKNPGFDLSFEFRTEKGFELWTGAVAIHPITEKRPLFIFGHHASTLAAVQSYVDKGVNALEFDLTFPYKNNQFSIEVKHSGDRDFTRTENVPAYFERIKELLDQNKLVVLSLDLKIDNKISQKDFAIYLAKTLKKFKIPPNKVVFSIPLEAISGLTSLWRDKESPAYYPAAVDGYSENYLKLPKDEWIRKAQFDKATFLGVGVDSHVPLVPIELWLQRISLMNNSRDYFGLIKKTFFWTVNNAEYIRNYMDLGVDAIMTDNPSAVFAVINAEPYRQLYRMANGNDSIRTIHGY